MQNPEHEKPIKTYNFKFDEFESKVVIEALMELQGKFSYTIIRNMETAMIEQEKEFANKKQADESNGNP